MKLINKPSFLAPIVVTAMLFIMMISDILGITDADSASAILVSTVVLQIIVFVLPMVFYANLKDMKYTKDVMLRPFALSRLGLIFALLGVMLTGSFLINILLSAVSGSEGGANSAQYLEIGGEGGMLLTVLAVCVAPAICEEFAFRGVLLADYKKYRALSACFVTSVLFAAVHLDLASFIPNVFCGLVLAWLVMVTRSLIASMLLHALYNICVVFVIPYLWRVTLEPMGTLFVVFALAGVFILCVLFSLGEAQAIYAEYARDPFMEKDIPNTKIVNVDELCRVFFSPTFIVCMIVFIIASLLL